MAGDFLLLAAALASALLTFRQTGEISEEQRLRLSTGRLALAFIAAAALGRLTLTAGGQDAETLKRILDNLALYAALPLLATAVLSQAMHWNWSRAGWGRWLLGLFALFELCRRMELGELYTLVMGAAIGLALLLSAIRLHKSRARLASAGSGLLLALAICAPVLPLQALPPLVLSGAQAVALLLIAFTLLNSLREPQPQ